MVATYERAHLKNQDRLELDHYPGAAVAEARALPGSLPLHRRERAASFRPPTTSSGNGCARPWSKTAARALIEVLLINRKHSRALVLNAPSQRVRPMSRRARIDGAQQ